MRLSEALLKGIEQSEPVQGVYIDRYLPGLRACALGTIAIGLNRYAIGELVEVMMEIEGMPPVSTLPSQENLLLQINDAFEFEEWSREKIALALHEAGL